MKLSIVVSCAAHFAPLSCRPGLDSAPFVLCAIRLDRLVHRAVRRADCDGSVIAKETESEILRLFHAEKWRIGTIAEQLGLHHTTVQRVLRPDRRSGK